MPPEGGFSLHRLLPVEVDQLVGLLTALPADGVPQRYLFQPQPGEHLADLRVIVDRDNHPPLDRSGQLSHGLVLLEVGRTVAPLGAAACLKAPVNTGALPYRRWLLKPVKGMI